MSVEYVRQLRTKSNSAPTSTLGRDGKKYPAKRSLQSLQTEDPLPSQESFDAAKKTLTEARAALLKIEQGELWTGSYSSFEDYCTKVLGKDYSEFLLDDEAWAEQEGQ